MVYRVVVGRRVGRPAQEQRLLGAVAPWQPACLASRLANADGGRRAGGLEVRLRLAAGRVGAAGVWGGAGRLVARGWLGDHERVAGEARDAEDQRELGGVLLQVDAVGLPVGFGVLVSLALQWALSCQPRPGPGGGRAECLAGALLLSLGGTVAQLVSS